MKSAISLSFVLFSSGALALPLALSNTLTFKPSPDEVVRRDVDPSLLPNLGITAGTNPDGTGNCDGTTGANGQPVKIPCACPPDQATLLKSLNANLDAGKVVNNPSIPPISFPTDNSAQSQIARIQAVVITLQNLNGSGVGCPAASTTLLAQQQALQNGGAAPAPAPPAPSPPAPAPAPPATSPAPQAASAAQVAQLAPNLGFQSGKNPTGTGDCDGAVNGANGQPVKVPCSCPPAQDEYISQLQANVAAGHAVKNPSVAVSFPTDNSAASQNARIEAAIITLQNLNGPGQGCPSASTTLSAQQAALQG